MSNGTTQRRARAASEQGLSLVELLVAMTIGLLLITGMIAVFSGNQRSSELNSAMTDMQESARFAIEAIARDARMAGFQGCIDVAAGAAIVRGNDAPTNDLFNSIATGSVVTAADTWQPDPPIGFTIPTGDLAPITGTHTLSLQFGSPLVSTLSSAMDDPVAPAAAAIPIADNPGGIRAGDLAIISNCDIADLFRVTTAPDSAGLITHAAADNGNNANLSRAYGTTTTLQNTRVMKFHANIYYIGITGEVNDYGDPVTALYQQSLPYTANNPPTQLIQGVENMRIRFGTRESNGNLRYFNANAAGFDPGAVEAIQVGLLMNSWSRIRQEDDTRTYVLAGQEVPPHPSKVVGNGFMHPGDKRYRLAFNTTVKIRNKR